MGAFKLNTSTERWPNCRFKNTKCWLRLFGLRIAANADLCVRWIVRRKDGCPLRQQTLLRECMSLFSCFLQWVSIKSTNETVSETVSAANAPHCKTVWLRRAKAV